MIVSTLCVKNFQLILLATLIILACLCFNEFKEGNLARMRIGFQYEIFFSKKVIHETTNARNNQLGIICEGHLKCRNLTAGPLCKPIQYVEGEWIPGLLDAAKHETKLENNAYNYQNDCNEGKFKCHIPEPNACRAKALTVIKSQWIPNNCHLIPFNAEKLIRKMRNKTLVFVGDSLMRQMFNSMRYLLKSQVTAEDYKRECFETRSNFSVYFEWSKFIVRTDNGSFELDENGWFARWKKADVLVINVGHHWHKIDKRFRKYTRMVRNSLTAFKKHFKGSLILYRTTSPGHYGCDSPLNATSTTNEKAHDRFHWQKPVEEEIVWKKTATEMQLHNFHILNISNTILRPDGHAEYKFKRRKLVDCLHWCLPGIPDFWNQFLFNSLMQLI
jgi:hypothetical protein